MGPGGMGPGGMGPGGMGPGGMGPGGKGPGGMGPGGMGPGGSGPGGDGAGMGTGGIGPGGMGPGGMGSGGIRIPKTLTDKDGKEVPQDFPAPLCEFVVQFAWKPRFEAEGGSLAGGLPALATEEGDVAAVAETKPATSTAGKSSAAGTGASKQYESEE